MTEQFPSPREVWVGSHGSNNSLNLAKIQFPAPIEVWVSSYLITKAVQTGFANKFPASLEGWVGSYNSMKNIAYAFAAFVSGPQRDMDGFLRKELEEAGFGWVLFPAPSEI